MTFDPNVPITRVEVIDDEGRQFVRWDIPKVELSFQDGGRTLKVFIGGRDEEPSMAWSEDDEGVEL